MSNWEHLDELVDEDRWWNLAYELFLENDPMEKITRHHELYKTAENWNDYGFDRNTRVPPTGKFRGVSRRAILVVISRSRIMAMQDWNLLSAFEHGTRVPDLQEGIKGLINSVIDLIYDENGRPRPFHRFAE